MISEQNYNMQNMQQNNQFQGQQFQNQQNSQFQQQYMPKNQNQGRNDMYNMNFQGQNDNMQSNNMKNMKYDQVMNTVSMMKFLKEYMQVHPMTSQDNYNMDNMVQRNTYSNQKDNTNQFSQELMRRMGGVQQKQNQFRFKRQVNGDTKPQGSDANTLPGFP